MSFRCFQHVLAARRNAACRAGADAFLAAVLICLLGLRLLPASPPEASVSVFAVSGIVLDPSGAVVSGAKVTLGGGGRRAEQSTTTDLTGAFRFAGVPAGGYEVQVEQTGFKQSRARLKAGPHAPAPLRVTLAIADLQEEITVAISDGRVNTEIAENLDVISLSGRLEDLPILSNDIVGAISKLLDPASVGSGGATVVVDGMVASEVRVPVSAIQEVRINQNPYSAEFFRPGRGRIEIITKTGSSSYHGSFDFGFRDYHLDARNAFAVRRPEEQRRRFEGYLSGPVGKAKTTTFLVSASRDQQDLQSVVYALGPTGGIRENFPKLQRGTYVSARVNRQTGKNTVSFRYSYFDWSDMGRGAGGFALPDVASDSTSATHSVYVSDRVVLTSKLINEFSVQSRREAGVTRSRRTGIPKIVVLDALTSGGAQADNGATESQVQLTDMVSWSHGRHFVKTGINVPDLSRRSSDDRTNFDGTFYFSSLEAYAQAKPFSFTRQQGDGRLAFWQREVGLFVQDDIRVRPDLSIALGLRYDWQNYLADHNNLAPRLSFAFAPGRSRKTVFRGGVGYFYDTTGTGPIADILRFDGRRLRQIVVSNPGFPDPLSGPRVLLEQPSTVVRFAPDLRSPYSVQYSFGIEQQLSKSTTLTANYLGTRGIKLFRSRDVNAPLPPLYISRPIASIGILRQIESSAHLESHALKVAVRGNLSPFFNGMVQYTLGRTYDDTNGIGSFPANQYDLSGEWSRASFDERHFLYVYGTLTPGKFFKLGVVLSMNSGGPYSLTTGRDDNRDSFANDRPLGVSRNSLEGPGSATLDLRWSRECFFHDGPKKEKGPSVTLGLDAFNVLNRVNYTSFVGNLSSPFFGGPVAATPARRMQVSFRFKF